MTQEKQEGAPGAERSDVGKAEAGGGAPGSSRRTAGETWRGSFGSPWRSSAAGAMHFSKRGPRA